MGDSKISRLQDTNCALKAHFYQSAETQFEYETLLVAGKGANVFQNEELWAIVVDIRQIGTNETVFEERVLSGIVPVHSRESLARRPSNQQLHLPALRQALAFRGVGLAFNSHGKQLVAVFGEHRAVGIVGFVRLGRGFEILDGPLGLGDACLVEPKTETSAAREDIEGSQGPRDACKLALVVVFLGISKGTRRTALA